MNRKKLIQCLLEIEENELLSLLREVFETRKPAMDNEYDQNKYFLGAALRCRNKKWDDWDQWKIQAIGYMDMDVYTDYPPEPAGNCCQSGTCKNCKIRVRSNYKNTICPICDAEVSVT